MTAQAETIATIVKGAIIGRWTVVREATPDRHSRRRVCVRCVCGAEALVLYHSLATGHTNGCNSVRCRNEHAPPITMRKPSRAAKRRREAQAGRALAQSRKYL